MNAAGNDLPSSKIGVVVEEGESGGDMVEEIRRCLSTAAKPLRDEWDSHAVDESRRDAQYSVVYGRM